MATDPPVSEKQRRAMYAALNGKSTLGIPKSVASKFVGSAHDMTPRDWDELIEGVGKLHKFLEEEKREPEHAEDREDDRSRGAGVAMRDPDGRLLFVKRSGTGDHEGEWAFPGGHAQVDESEEAAAIRELGEEIGFYLRQPLTVKLGETGGEGFKFTTYQHDCDEAFVPDLNDEHEDYLWAKPDAAPTPLHPGVAELLGQDEDLATKVTKNSVGYAIGKGVDRCRNCVNFNGPQTCVRVLGVVEEDGWCELFHMDGVGMDESMAFDRESVRDYDVDGRLRVTEANISKANVCPYVGKEIPNWKGLGLQVDKIYHLLRDPEELRKAAETFNGVPLLMVHKPHSAKSHDPGVVIGATGTEARFEHPYLKNSLVVWPEHAIDAIESGDQRELSCGYRYRADMTPGTYMGADYDGVMRDIVGNHVALVREGRAGSDVIVGDSRETIAQHQETKMKVKLSRKAAMAQGALTVFLTPLLAQDAKLPDLAPVLADVTSKNWKDKKSEVAKGVESAMKKVKLAQDASLSGVPAVLDGLDAVMAEDDELQTQVDRTDADADKRLLKNFTGDAEGLKNFLKDKVSEDTMKALDAYLAGDDPPEFAGKPVKGEDDEDDERRQGMDEKTVKAIVETAVKSATSSAVQEQRAIREAERAIRPYVGELAEQAFDSADEVYRKALTMLGVKGADKIHSSALPTILGMMPKRGTKQRGSEPVIAADQSTVVSFDKLFPTASRIGAA